jgi:hypothetical protein
MVFGFCSTRLAQGSARAQRPYRTKAEKSALAGPAHALLKFHRGSKALCSTGDRNTQTFTKCLVKTEGGGKMFLVTRLAQFARTSEVAL